MSKSFSQELLGQKNTIEITQTSFSGSSVFKDPGSKGIKVFDKKGRLIKDIEFGFHHNTDLHLVGQIRTYDYLKDKLIFEKTYASGADYKIKNVQFYWNYKYENSRKKKAISNHSNYEFKYDSKNRLAECHINHTWDSSNIVYTYKYNSQNKIIEKTQFYGDNIKNWTKTYSQKGDTLISKHYSFKYPKKKDTTISIIKEVFKNDKLSFSHTFNFGEKTNKYVYSVNGQLLSVFTIILDDKEKELKNELIYFDSGIIKQIREYELEKDNWVLKQRAEFEIRGRTSILNKKETKNLNKILIKENINWLQQWL